MHINHAPVGAIPAPVRDNLRGVIWILISVLGASAMSIGVKALGASIDSRMLVALRAGLSVALLLPALLVVRQLRAMRFTKPWLHLTRGTLIAVATHLGFYTLTELPLATSAVLMMTAPIFATVIAALTQNEYVGPRRWGAVIVGFLGAIVILRPGLAPLDWAMVTALGSSACFAIALTQSRALAEADGPVAAYVSSVVVTLVLSIPVALPVASLPPTALAWGLVAVVMVSGIIRGIADIQAYRHAEASVLGPVTYLRLVLIGFGGYFFFSEKPDIYTYLGAAIIVGATLYIARREAMSRRQARAAMKASESLAGP
ncbi:DMT family transporter [Oceanibium sediminis]|uniref:DMT family transporter n=1 Tax=Oceanibium sediminis TaxID=2026339 RepID=UPI0018E4E447|nr:DMT family transporter [Oceanibium sediminis]